MKWLVIGFAIGKIIEVLLFLYNPILHDRYRNFKYSIGYDAACKIKKDLKLN
tara:strand:+ start:718 stop:873 length:156 start_codon:yes stop_codon:yes gene_type:complete